eukprot:scaffold1399_cov48-Cyclotella_meneghiniana.AAC.6
MKLTVASMSIAALCAPSISASGVAASILKHENNQGSVRLSAPKNKECSFVDGFKVNVQESMQVGIHLCEIGELCEEDSTSPLGGRCVTVSSKPIALTPQRQLVGGSWAQVGQDIDGAAADDQSGYSVSLSGDGSVLAIGAYGNSNGNGSGSGHVRVFKLDTNGWTQVGQDIDGEAADDQSGYSVSLSADGNVLAIGAPYNAGNNGNQSGHVRVFKLDTNSWTQVGEDIDGEAAGDRSGHSVSLSGDGNVLAIGAYGNNGNNGSNSGHVRVYRLVDNSWTQVGEDIDGEAANDWSGHSVSLSGDGNVLAIGATGNDANGNLESGHVRVFKLVNNSWTQVGEDIDGEAAYDGSAISMSLSSDGNVLAIGADGNDGNGSSSGHVRVFKLVNNGWTQVGEDIDGEAAGDGSGRSVSLSSDGNVLAIGASLNDGNGSSSGHVRVFKLDTNSWTQVGEDIDGEAADDRFGSSVSLSSDGSVLAIGAYGNDGNGIYSGHVRVFESFPVTPAPTAAPVTPSPSLAPVTHSPMATPVTPSPSTAPVTPPPSAAPVTSSPTTEPGWSITYGSMKASLTAGSTEELIFMYNISSTRAYEYELFQKDCSTEIGGNLVTSNRTIIEPLVAGAPQFGTKLTLFYDIDQSAISSSPIWNPTSQDMEICVVLNLVEPATVNDEKMILAQDKHVFTVGINSTVDFRFDNTLEDSVDGKDSDTTNLDDYVEACKCTDEEVFVCDSTPLAPNEEFHVCVKSSSSDVRINDVTQMNIDQGDQSLTVVEGSQIKYSSFSSKNSYPEQNGYKINVLLPINLLNFSGSNVTVEGTLEMQLGGRRRALRQLVVGNGPEAAPFKLEIALTDTPVASEINDVEEGDSAPPGILVPVLAVVGSVPLLAMAGVAMAFRKRGAYSSGGIIA